MDLNPNHLFPTTGLLAMVRQDNCEMLRRVKLPRHELIRLRLSFAFTTCYSSYGTLELPASWFYYTSVAAGIK